MFSLSTPARTYFQSDSGLFFLFVLLRFMGKKHVGELAPFDLLVLLIISETVQNALIGDDKSLVGGLISSFTLLAISLAMNYLSWRSKKIDRVLEGVPKVLVRNGHCKGRIDRSDARGRLYELVKRARRDPGKQRKDFDRQKMTRLEKSPRLMPGVSKLGEGMGAKLNVQIRLNQISRT